MTDYTTILHILQCPHCGGKLTQKQQELICDRQPSHHYPITNGILRFVNPQAGIAYNKHWSKFSKNSLSQTKIQQANHFINWLLNNENLKNVSDKVFLDVGCGDGNHLPFFPEAAIKIALDYSYAVDIVANRYKEVKNLFILQADAQHLPFKENVIDYCIAYGSLNCLASPGIGVHEVARVLKVGGLAALWGYGTNSSFIFYSLKWVRLIYKLLPNSFLRYILTVVLIPFLSLIKNSTDIKLGKNSFEECYEIVSTNLTPEYLHIFYRNDWRSFCPNKMAYIEDYELPCGQKFRIK